VKRGLVLRAVVALVATACGEPAGAAASTEADRARLFALALRQLVTVDSSFGSGNPFSAFLVRSSVDPAAGAATVAGPVRPLSPAESGAIEAALADLAPVRWIGNPAAGRSEDLRPIIEGAAILGVGEPRFDDAGALVPVSLWCGGLCGTWLTYRLTAEDGDWTLVGPEGPVAVS